MNEQFTKLSKGQKDGKKLINQLKKKMSVLLAPPKIDEDEQAKKSKLRRSRNTQLKSSQSGTKSR
jgi:hypothetical protein